MAAKKKSTKKVEKPIEEDVIVKTEELEDTQKESVVMPEPEKEEKTEEPEIKTKKSTKKEQSIPAPGPKYEIGAIVFINKEANADLNGFKLFPQYKKYTYTVEAYDEISGVYTLRRLNLSLRLPEDLILAPDERAHDQLNRRQF